MQRFLLLLLTLAISSAAETLYNITDLGSVDRTASEGWGVNNYGEVVGRSSNGQGTSEGFVWDGGRPNSLGPRSSATAINEAGLIVGQTDGKAAKWDGTGQHALPTLGGANGSANAVNSQGNIAGGSETANGELHATLYRGTQATDLGHLGDGWSAAYGVNDFDSVTGYGFDNGMARAFHWTEAGGMQEIGTLGGGQSWGMGINNGDEITGHSTLASGYAHAFVFDTEMRDLGTLGGDSSYGYSINDRRMVVGYSYDAGGQQRAFLWSDGYLYDLNNLLAGSGWLLQAAYGINNAGQIVGTGKYGNISSAFLLNPESSSGQARSADPMAPVPEPGTAVLFSSSLLALTAWNNKRR